MSALFTTAITGKRRSLWILCVALLALLQNFDVRSANAHSATDQQDNVIVDAIDNLQFGAIFLGATAGTVTIAPSGQRTTSGGVYPYVHQNFEFGPATISIRSSNSHNPTIPQFTLLLPSSVTMKRTGGGTMVVNNLTKSTPVTVGYEKHCAIGGTLNVSSGQNSGNYTGQFEVVIAFQ